MDRQAVALALTAVVAGALYLALAQRDSPRPIEEFGGLCVLASDINAPSNPVGVDLDFAIEGSTHPDYELGDLMVKEVQHSSFVTPWYAIGATVVAPNADEPSIAIWATPHPKVVYAGGLDGFETWAEAPWDRPELGHLHALNETAAEATVWPIDTENPAQVDLLVSARGCVLGS